LTLSVLDLAPILQGGTPAEAFRHSLQLAQHAERLGYRRFWLAEHHNMPGIGSAATSVLIGHVGAGTSRIRIGAGGIMLPNHAPLQVAVPFRQPGLYAAYARSSAISPSPRLAFTRSSSGIAGSRRAMLSISP
jgi:luciferase family oxidoreductase group 1